MSSSLPVTVESKNYSSICIVGLCLIVVGFWFTIGKGFKGPDIHWNAINVINVTADAYSLDRSSA